MAKQDDSFRKNLPTPRPATPRPLPAPRPVPSPAGVAKGTWGGARPGAGAKPAAPTPLPPSLRDPTRLGTFRGRPVPNDAEPDLHEQIAFARSQIARVAAGEFSHRRAPTILKAAIALLDEALGKLEDKTKLSGMLTLSAAVAAASREIEAAEPRPALPPHGKGPPDA